MRLDTVVLPGPTADTDLLATYARRILLSDGPMERSSTTLEHRFAWGGNGVCLPIFTQKADDYSGTPDDVVDEIMRNLLRTLVDTLETDAAGTGRRRRAALQEAVRVQILIDLPLFLDAGVDHAEAAVAECETPWKRRSVSLKQHATPPFRTRRLVDQLPPAPRLPTACQADLEHLDDGTEWLALTPFRAELAMPWEIGAIETMRRIAAVPAPWDAGVAADRSSDMI